jgi:hypothetical protein
MDYLDQGLPFHAHEVLEQRWRCCPEDERGAWRALAQWAAAHTHQARGNQVGARRVAERALAGIDALAGDETPASPNGFDRLPEPVDAGLVWTSLESLIRGSDKNRC